MSTAPRILACSVSLTALLFIPSSSIKAADQAVPRGSMVGVELSKPRWDARPPRLVGPRRARCEFVEGIRGATPLTVPFFGSGWYPGPAHYASCWRYQEGAVISVRY